MAVSMAVVPLLKGDAAKAFIKDINSAHILPYSSQERKRTIESLENKITENKGFIK